ncbi:tyrosine-type recombinase/integrase, partial [Acidithiobacillus sp. MC6.1]|nr:tyrosine-type recombinase/integrase [Acidithiobacillus sp. MC6.1]
YYVCLAMEMAYLCRMRISEVLAAKWAYVTEDGVLVRRGKGSRDGMTLWSDRLRDAIEACRTHGSVKGMTILHGENGAKIPYDTFATAWQRLMTKAKAEGLEPFTFHDLKAKGV